MKSIKRYWRDMTWAEMAIVVFTITFCVWMYYSEPQPLRITIETGVRIESH
jgi:hypothetical protein